MTSMVSENQQSNPARPTVTFHESPGASEGVETDPSHRYLRYPFLLGRGACKRVYKAFDQTEGIEVAWNQVELTGSDMDEAARERLFAEIRVLQTLKHRNIMRFYDWWYDAKTMTINFITEYFTSGNLRQYRKKHKIISEQAIKRWAFQILEGLMYLHAHDPPIIHRDLKCDNILVNGTSGQVKIADLGLASCQRGLSVVGTPEFMAPEIYDEVYDEKVDIYSFGMCMLELATLEYPYSECRSIPAIFRKVSQGIPPAALAKVTSQPLRGFITTCINQDPRQRPQALQLLRHEFFDSLKPESDGSNHSGYLSIPFGSCGNLQTLGVSGSHSRNSFGRSSRPKTLSCAECTAVARAMKQAAIEQAEAEAAACAKAATTAAAVPDSQHAAPDPANCAQGGVLGTNVNGDCGRSSIGVNNQQQGGTKQAVGASLPVVQDSSYARGRSVCLALLNRSEPEEYVHCCEEDSDDEVVVSLEDVLTPHPGDLLDPDTSHLHSTLRRAGSGCTIVSGPNCILEGRLSEFSLSGLLDAAAASGASISISGCQTPAGLAAKSVQYAAAGVGPLGRSARSSTDTRPVSARDGTSAAAVSCLPANSTERQVRSDSSSRRSSTLHSGAGLHTLQDHSASGLGSLSCSSSLLGSLSESLLLSQMSAASAMAAAISSRTPSSLTGPGSWFSAASADNTLHRSVSTCSLQANRGALAAAGLLQMSPGVFVSTPPLLEKLLSRSGRPPLAKRPAGGPGSHKRSSSTCSGGRANSAGQARANSAGQARATSAGHVASAEHSKTEQLVGPSSHQHGLAIGFRSNSFSAPSLNALADCGAGLIEGGVAAEAEPGQSRSELGGALGESSTEDQQELETNEAVLGGTTAELIDKQVEPKRFGDPIWDRITEDDVADEATPSGYCRSGSVTCDGAISAAAAVQTAGHCITPGIMSSVLRQGSAFELSPMAGAAAAGAAGAGAVFGRIVVRRRFARNLQQRAVVSLQRSQSV